MIAEHRSPNAIAELADLWTSADVESRRKITEATREIDRLLSREALAAGESRDESYRILMVPPLGIEFVPEESLGVAYVHRVWKFKTPRSN